MHRKAPPRNSPSRNPTLMFLDLNRPDAAIVFKLGSITISGSMEDAAWILANDIIKQTDIMKQANPDAIRHLIYPSSHDRGLIEAICGNGLYTIALLDENAMDPDTWMLFKKSVEKICNKLKAFM